MSAKGLLRYRSEVGATDPLNGRNWPQSSSGGKKSPTGSVASSSSSEDIGSPEAGSRMLEEDSFDEGIEDILARSPSCNLCGHTFYSSADFLNHVRMHFSGPPAKGKKRSVDEAWPEEKGRTGSQQEWAEKGERMRRTPPPAYNAAVDLASRQSRQGSPQDVDDAALDQLQQFLPSPTEELDTPEFERCLSPLNLPETQMNLPEPRQPEPQQVPPQQTLTPPLSSPLLPHTDLPENFLEQLLATQKTGHPVPSYQPDLQAQISQIPAHFGFNLNFPNNPFFRPSVPQFSLPLPLSLPHLPSYSSLPLLRPTNLFKCFMCPATFDKREALMYHLNFHTSYSAAAESAKPGTMIPNTNPYFPNLQHQNPSKQSPYFNQQPHEQTNSSKKLKSSQQSGQYPGNSPYAGYPPYQPFPSPEPSPLSGGSYSNHSPPLVCSHPSPRCSCEGCSKAKQAKKPKKPVEDIDTETLKKIQKLEWERKHGYWCTKCKKRFASQAKLVDHMSYSEEHNFKESDKDKNSDVDSAQGSPDSMGQRSPTLMSPLDVSGGGRSPLDPSRGSPFDAPGEVRSPLNISDNISSGLAQFGDQRSPGLVQFGDQRSPGMAQFGDQIH